MLILFISLVILITDFLKVLNTVELHASKFGSKTSVVFFFFFFFLYVTEVVRLVKSKEPEVKKKKKS